SSRRRHTRWPRDWSSDVCSSDLRDDSAANWHNGLHGLGWTPVSWKSVSTGTFAKIFLSSALPSASLYCRAGATRDPSPSNSKDRSEERRVGKDRRRGSSTD